MDQAVCGLKDAEISDVYIPDQTYFHIAALSEKA